MVPLHRLREGSHRLAVGDFSTPCPADGPPEFAQLSRDFNQMADELHAFYRQLEEMVASKSRELVRSERLASVGFLAAGVAHEINTPLHVISGYAELCAKRLRRLPASEQTAELLGWQDMIRDEAIRCRQITDKLLSLCRGAGGGPDHEIVSLTRLASDVAMMVRGLPNFQGRKVTVSIDPSDLFSVNGNAAELKQVLLNLTVNALEAVSVGTGEVVVDAKRLGESIELTVTDNGRGMDAATLQHVFEPFFTSKRGSVGGAGTGLGLSITHAIVTSHGGRIAAESAGLGRGSRFTIELPAASSDADGSRAIATETDAALHAGETQGSVA
jgi:signal transduction histidine kinase